MHNGNKKKRSAVNSYPHLASLVDHCLINLLECSGNGNTCFQKGDQIKISKNIDHQNVKTLPNVSHISQPTLFSLVPTFNPLPYGIWSAVHDMARGPPGHPCEDDIRESKDDYVGRLHSCHALAMRKSTVFELLLWHLRTWWAGIETVTAELRKFTFSFSYWVTLNMTIFNVTI